MNLVWNVVTTGTMAGPLRYDQIDHIPAHLLDKLPRKISKSFYSALLKLQFCKILLLYFTQHWHWDQKKNVLLIFKNCL